MKDIDYLKKTSDYISSGKAEKALKAWFAKMFLSARNNILGLLKPSRFKFQRVWNNFQAI